MGLSELVASVVSGALGGLGYALVGILTKRDDGEPIDPRKAARTVVLFTAAGVLVGIRGNDASRQAVNNAMVEVWVIGVLFDMVWSKARREEWIPERLVLTERSRNA